MALISGALIIMAVSLHAGAVVTKCTTDGFTCRERCTELVRCTTTSNDTITEQVVRRCPPTIGQLCNLTTRDCTAASCEDANLDDVKFTCHEDGFYPHPAKCDRYYSCNKSLVSDFLCPKETSYNAVNKNCSNAYAECTATPIPRCRTITDIGAYSADPNIYYVCAYDQFGYLRPELHKCANGYYFNEENVMCVVGSSASVISINAFLIVIAILKLV